MLARTLPLLVLLVVADVGRAQLQIHVVPGPAGPAVAPPEGRRAPTLAAALRQIAEARAAGDAAPARILLHDGTHPVDAPIVLTPSLVADGLEIAAAPGCMPTISGGRPITGLAAHPNGSWRTTIDDVRAGRWWFEELFVDGRRATRARHPDDGFARVVVAAPDNRTGFSFDPAAVPPGLLDERAEVVLLHDWSISRVPIEAVDLAASALTTTHPLGCGAPHYAITNFEPHPRFFVEGSPRLADAPGEWALDRPTGELVYRPRAGESIDDARLVAPFAPALLRVAGAPDAPIGNVALRGIRFAHASWPIPSYGYAEGQASFYEQRDTAGSDGTRDAIPAAVELAWAERCTIEGCTIESVGGTGVQIGAGCRDCTITGCTVRDTGANGVMLGEAAGRTVDGAPWWRAAPGQAATDNALRRSLIERCGQRFFGAVGVWIGLARRTEVSRCEIRDLPYTGVSVGWRWDATPTPCGGNVVEFNHIHHVMQVLSDGGGVYTLGLQPGTVLRGNAIHDVRRNAGRAPSNGVFLDQGTTGIVIEDNVFWSIDTTPLRWHLSHRNVVRGNTFVLGEGQRTAHYNAAAPEDILYEDNRTVAAETWDPSEAASIVRATGPGARP